MVSEAIEMAVVIAYMSLFGTFSFPPAQICQSENLANLNRIALVTHNGVFEPEGAGTSPLNSVSDNNMYLTKNRHFFTYQINIFVSVRV